jgi:ribonuclease-3
MEILGYDFKDEPLLEEALTTPAYRMENPNVRDNQRLEFLGDSVLGLLAADRLYAEHPGANEGSLTVMRTRMVSAAALCRAADRLGLASHLRWNKGAAPAPKGSKTLADAVEALIGAAWLDGGLAAARKVFDALGLSPEAPEDIADDNPKGALQIKAQAMKPPRHPEYTLVKTAGKSHEPIFTVKVEVDGLGEAFAEARSRKEAEAQAAAKLLGLV